MNSLIGVLSWPCLNISIENELLGMQLLRKVITMIMMDATENLMQSGSRITYKLCVHPQAISLVKVKFQQWQWYRWLRQRENCTKISLDASFHDAENNLRTLELVT